MAGRLALERADHQLVAVEEVEADPVEPRQGVVDQRGEVGGVGDAVALAGDQRAGLLGQLRVLFGLRSEEHTSELQSLMRISYAVFCLKKKKTTHMQPTDQHNCH